MCRHFQSRQVIENENHDFRFSVEKNAMGGIFPNGSLNTTVLQISPTISLTATGTPLQ
jgi:hypothetical protein